MELFRQEYNLKQPPNYGEQLFHKLKYNKENERGYYAPSEAVRRFLELNPSPVGPLDATEILNQVGSTFVL